MTHTPGFTPKPDPTGSDPSEAGWANLARAAEQLRHRPEPRAVEVANDVLRRALQSSRPSLPIRAHAPYDYVRISDRLLISSLREAIDRVSDTVAVGQVILLVTPRGVLEQVTVELLVQYGEVILEAADRVRLIVSRVVADLLGIDITVVQVVATTAEEGGQPASGTLTTHVHVSDVTRASPHVVDPSDEQA